METFTEYLEAWKDRDAAFAEKASVIRKRLWEILPEISRSLMSLGAGEALVFGSLIEGDFKIGSDLDLGVKGLPENKYLDAIILTEKILSPLGVDFDLVLYERAFPWIKEKIDKGTKI
jgi:predicted nucleotidyltransferase